MTHTWAAFKVNQETKFLVPQESNIITRMRSLLIRMTLVDGNPRGWERRLETIQEPKWCRTIPPLLGRVLAQWSFAVCNSGERGILG